MVMWQILIGLALKARNDQPVGPARRGAVHAFLSKRKGRKGGGEEERGEIHAVTTCRRFQSHVSKGKTRLCFED